MTDKINFDDFAKIELKIGKILKVEEHPNAEKLFILSVDFDEETPRTICAGLRSYYKKEELENKKAIFVTNLEPRQLRGIESNGMILAILSEDKSQASILTLDKDMQQGLKAS
jgi:methionyl-tRNA synthetase